MMPAKIWVRSVADDVLDIDAPFSVLLDADEENWDDACLVRRLGKSLLADGCRYFVCFGQRSEVVHDLLDDVIVTEGYQGVTTTFHDDEDKEEVLDFLMDCAARGMKGALVFVRNTIAWETSLTNWMERSAISFPSTTA